MFWWQKLSLFVDGLSHPGCYQFAVALTEPVLTQSARKGCPWAQCRRAEPSPGPVPSVCILVISLASSSPTANSCSTWFFSRSDYQFPMQFPCRCLNRLDLPHFSCGNLVTVLKKDIGFSLAWASLCKLVLRLIQHAINNRIL